MEIEYVNADGLEPGSGIGLAAVAAASHDLLEAWEGFRIEAERFRELDEDWVFVLARAGGRGRMSRLELQQMQGTGASLCHVRDGKVTRLVNYMDRDHALAELGLTPDTAT